MKVLILSFFYQPEPNDIKAHALGRELVARGHDVTAITTFPNYPTGEIYKGYTQKWRQWEDKDGVKLARIPLYADHSRSSIKRALSYLSFLTSASVLGPFLGGKPDVMWIYQPPLTTGMAGWWISKLRRAPFVYEIQDMWPETLTSTGMINNKRALSLLAAIARQMYRSSAAITVISPGFKQNLITKGVSPEKVHVIPNWAEEEIYEPLPRDPEIGEKYGLSGKFNIIFGGNMGPAQALHLAIEAAEALQDLPDLQFVMIGDGLELPSLQESVQERGLKNVIFLGRQPSEKMPQFFAWGDGLLVQLKDDPLFAITIPSKTLAYLATGRPIVCAVPGDGADVVREAGAGVVCLPGDASALEKAIRELYTMSASEREMLGKAAREAYETHYRRDIAIDRYEALFEEIIARKKR